MDANRLKVLIVDDHATNRKLLRASLEAEGHTVLDATNGITALEVLAQAEVNAIVSDILMPQMDGLQLCLQVRNDPRTCCLPFIIYTSTYDSPADRQLAADVGADRYIVKPAPIANILGAVRDIRENMGNTRRVPAATSDTATVYKHYNEGLVAKLEAKNEELRQAMGELRSVNTKVVELNQTLEARVKKRTQELASANSELSRRNEEIQGFYHTLAHELKTPLTSAREFTCLVLEGLAGEINPTQEEYLNLAKESCDQMRRCLDDLLDASRLDTGKLSLEIRDESLPEIVAKVVRSLEPAASAKQILIQSSSASNLGLVPLDEYRVVQLISNLINNAVKFTASGGSVEVAVRASPDRKGFQEVRVRDTGCGIPADRIHRVFDRLYQVRDEDAEFGQGLGLGLYLCRELALLHGGDIAVMSKPGVGSTFTVLFPETLPTKSNPSKTNRGSASATDSVSGEIHS